MNDYDKAMKAIKIIGAVEYLVNTSGLDKRSRERILARTEELVNLMAPNQLNSEQELIDYTEEFESDVEDQKKRDWEDLHGDSGALY